MLDLVQHLLVTDYGDWQGCIGRVVDKQGFV